MFLLGLCTDVVSGRAVTSGDSATSIGSSIRLPSANQSHAVTPEFASSDAVQKEVYGAAIKKKELSWKT